MFVNIASADPDNKISIFAKFEAWKVAKKIRFFAKTAEKEKWLRFLAKNSPKNSQKKPKK